MDDRENQNLIALFKIRKLINHNVNTANLVYDSHKNDAVRVNILYPIGGILLSTRS